MLAELINMTTNYIKAAGAAVGDIKWSICMQISTFYRQEAKIKPFSHKYLPHYMQ